MCSCHVCALASLAVTVPTAVLTTAPGQLCTPPPLPPISTAFRPKDPMPAVRSGSCLLHLRRALWLQLQQQHSRGYAAAAAGGDAVRASVPSDRSVNTARRRPAQRSPVLPLPAARPQPTVKLFINGEFKDSSADRWVNVTNPVRGRASVVSEL